MKTRLITAGIAAALAIALIVLGSFFSVIITISLSIVSVILCGEYLSAKKLNKDMKLFIPSLAFAFLIPLLSGIKYVCYIPLFVFVFGMFVLSVVFHRSFRTNDMMFSLVGVTLITVSLSRGVLGRVLSGRSVDR